MDVQRKLDEIAEALQGARSMPMSASCVVNRAELLGMLNEVREALPGSLAQAQQLLGGREQLVEEARREAEQILDEAQNRRSALISDTEVARGAQAEADRILGEARQEAEQISVEADDYVDSKLANFEVVLTKTIGSVDRGRDKLLGRAPGYDDPQGYGPDGQDPAGEAPERSADPQEQRRRADTYVDAQFQAFQSVLTKTLEAVGRGRQKLQGARPTDQLGETFGQAGLGHAGTDESYLAELAELADGPAPGGPAHQRPGAPEPLAQPPAPPHAVPQPAAAYYDGTAAAQGYAQSGYPQPEQPDYPQGDYQQGYGYQQGYEQPDPGYGWPQQAGQPEQPGPGAYADPGQQAPYGQGEPHLPQQGGYTPAPAALDETSLFDTSMIDLEQLRQYDERGR